MLVEIETRIKTIQPLYGDRRDGDHGLTAQEIARQSDIPLVNVESVLTIWQRWGYVVIDDGNRYRLTDAGERFADKLK
jgi:DNA-binding IclR family transcriptional regulator